METAVALVRAYPDVSIILAACGFAVAFVLMAVVRLVCPPTPAEKQIAYMDGMVTWLRRQANEAIDRADKAEQERDRAVAVAEECRRETGHANDRVQELEDEVDRILTDEQHYRRRRFLDERIERATSLEQRFAVTV